jgi:hypothetical protein
VVKFCYIALSPKPVIEEEVGTEIKIKLEGGLQSGKKTLQKVFHDRTTIFD